MSFYIARSDTSGDKIAATELLLNPGPTRVEYPQEPAGKLLETDDGHVIQQQPVKDGRIRAWVWLNYQAWMLSYQLLWTTLEGLRSRYRVEAGSSPYVWLKDTETGLLRQRFTDTGTATGVGNNTLTDSTKTWTTDALIGMTVEIISGTGEGQTRVISDNTGTSITVATDWDTNPTGADYNIRGWIDDWVRVRVVEVSRSLREDGGLVKYPETKMAFVIDDPNWNNFG